MRSVRVFGGNRAILCLLACLALPLAHPVAADAQIQRLSTPGLSGIRIPFQWDRLQHPYIIVQARINDQGKTLRLMVDTGSAAPLILSEEAAKEIGLKEEGQPIRYGESSHTPYTVLVGAKVGLLDTDGKAIAVNFDLAHLLKSSIVDMMAKSGEEKVDGIFGISCLRTMECQLDFAQKTLTIYPAGTQPPAPKDTATVTVFPLIDSEEQAQDSYSGLPQIAFGPSASIRALIDTGSISSVLAESEAKHLTDIQGTPYQEQMIEAGGVSVGQKVSEPALAFGTLMEPNVAFTVISDTPGRPATLGMSYLSRFRMTLDYPNKQITFERASDYADTVKQEPGAGDVILSSKPEAQYIIESVMGGSPAEEAGLKPGDRLVQIDGVNVNVDAGSAQPFSNAIRRRLNGIAGTQARLQVSRNGALKEFTYTRQGYIAASPSGPSFGFSVAEAAGETAIVVDGIDAGSVAEKAGLHVGDTIVAISGTPIKDKSISDILSLVSHARRSGVLVLSVLAKDTKQPHEVKMVLPTSSSPVSR